MCHVHVNIKADRSAIYHVFLLCILFFYEYYKTFCVIPSSKVNIISSKSLQTCWQSTSNLISTWAPADLFSRVDIETGAQLNQEVSLQIWSLLINMLCRCRQNAFNLPCGSPNSTTTDDYDFSFFVCFFSSLQLSWSIVIISLCFRASSVSAVSWRRRRVMIVNTDEKNSRRRTEWTSSSSRAERAP